MRLAALVSLAAIGCATPRHSLAQVLDSDARVNQVDAIRGIDIAADGGPPRDVAFDWAALVPDGCSRCEGRDWQWSRDPDACWCIYRDP